jgi:O-antigen ligase
MINILIYILLFFQGYNNILPLSESKLPFWAHRYEFYGFGLDQFTFFLILIMFLYSTPLRNIKFHKTVLFFIVLVLLFGVTGFISTIVNLEDLHDFGEAMRFFYFAVFVYVIVKLSRYIESKNLLKSYLIGLLIGGIINLYFTLSLEERIVGTSTLPTLLGQNGPGSQFGLSILFSCWLMKIQTGFWDKSLSIILLLIGVFGSLISYSKTAMLIGLLGLTAWLIYYLFVLTLQKKLYVGLFLTLILYGLYSSNSEKGKTYTDSFKTYIEFKFGNLDASENNSIRTRSGYWFGVSEIFISHPVFGVGYSGFYENIISTSAYKLGQTPEEEENSFSSANPHNSFLYYVSANGIFGLFLFCFILITYFIIIFQYFINMKLFGFFYFYTFLLSYVIYFNTLSTLINSPTFYLPIVVVMSSIYGKGRNENLFRPVVITFNKC